VGRLKQERWQDPEGNNRSKVHGIAEHVEFVPVRKGQGEGVEEDQEQSREEGDGEEDREAASF